MKKTIITMLVLGGVAMAAQTTENVAFTSPSSTITTANKYDLTEDWSLSLEFICGAGTMFGNTTNLNGTTILESDVLGVKVYAESNVDATVTIGSFTDTKALAEFSLWGRGWAAGQTTTLNLSYTDGVLTLTAFTGGYKQFSFENEMTYDGDSAVSLTTGISQDHLAVSSGQRQRWSLPTGTFTGTVPEPATATLSLLALAGLAARRRRK